MRGDPRYWQLPARMDSVSVFPRVLVTLLARSVAGCGGGGDGGSPSLSPAPPPASRSRRRCRARRPLQSLSRGMDLIYFLLTATVQGRLSLVSVVYDPT
jgi:hypothetical protein